MNTPPSKFEFGSRLPAIVAAGLGFVCVAGGAFGAHGLEGTIPPRDLAAFETGMRYGLIHALATLIALLFSRQGVSGAMRSSWCFIIGIVLFSGSLAVLGLTGSRALVLLTPLGGLSFLAGWLLLGLSFYRER